MKTISKILAVALAVMMLCSIIPMNAAAAGAYELASSIEVGDTVVLACTSKKMELSSMASKYGNGVSYTATPSGTYALTVVAGYTAGTYAFKTAEGKYLNWSSDNSLTTGTAVNQNTSWKVTFSGTSVTIVNAKDNNRKLQWNASSPRFACYTTNQTAVQLYKLNQSVAVCEHANKTTTPSTPATCTQTGLTEKIVCDDCKEVLKEQEVIALAPHTYTDGKCSACGAEEPNEINIVFNLGENGTIAKENSNASTTYTEKVGDYTLNLTGGDKMYTACTDGMGNGCIKLGTSSVVGKFSFTVPSDVTSVIIAVTGYKDKTSTIKINNASHTLKKSSNNGEYEEFSIDTTTNKTVSVTTVSGGVRAFVGSITYVVPKQAEPACEHEYAYDCSKNCKLCGEETRPEAAHQYFYACDPVCMICYELTNPEAAHNMTFVPAKDATCTENGNIAYWTCDACGGCWDNENATGMPLNRMMVTVPAAHTYDNDCDPDCNVCFENRKELNHNVIHVEAVPATCTTEGNIEYWYCDVCGAAWLDAECTLNTNLMSVKQPASCSYSAVYTAAKEATCFEPGNVEYWYCENCDVYYADAACAIVTNAKNVIIPITHNVIHVEAKAPTCTENGNIEYWYCADCGQAWLDELCHLNTNLKAVKLPIADHSYDNNYDADCNVCGAEREVAAFPIIESGKSASEDCTGYAVLFDANVEGLELVNGAADYTNATYNGYKLLSLGVVATNGKSETTIKGDRVYGINDETGVLQFAFRIINIPADKLDAEITMTPYYIVEIDGVATTLSGDAIVGSYAEVAAD